MAFVKMTVVLDRPLPLFSSAEFQQRVTGMVNADNPAIDTYDMLVDERQVIIPHRFVAAVVVEKGDFNAPANA